MSSVALRVMPTVGAEVLIDHLGVVQHGVVVSVGPDARSLQVATDDRQLQTFTLNRATARFTLHGGLVGPRLRFAAGDSSE
jgi:hypothetical protein